MLQIDEHVNISAAAKHRYEKANAGIKRCLKLMLTDGRQSFSGIEHKPIPDLTLGLPSGCKVLVSGPVQVVRGIAMLSPANFIILGTSMYAFMYMYVVWSIPRTLIYVHLHVYIYTLQVA